jgi:sulfonate transport system substrate-binding protein
MLHACAVGVLIHFRGLRSEFGDEGSLKVVRIGYQKYGSFNVVKARHTFDDELAKRAIKIDWILFPAGPQLLEAMNAGAIDLGHTGEAPPIFAQAANNPFVYIGNHASPRSPR